MLKVYQGFKFDEMAEILECPVSTVKSRLYTALELLKSELAPANTRGKSDEDARKSSLATARKSSAIMPSTNFLPTIAAPCSSTSPNARAVRRNSISCASPPPRCASCRTWKFRAASPSSPIRRPPQTGSVLFGIQPRAYAFASACVLALGATSSPPAHRPTETRLRNPVRPPYHKPNSTPP